MLGSIVRIKGKQKVTLKTKDGQEIVITLKELLELTLAALSKAMEENGSEVDLETFLEVLNRKGTPWCEDNLPNGDQLITNLVFALRDKGFVKTVDTDTTIIIIIKPRLANEFARRKPELQTLGVH